jgi:ring-1,2-phenylacetyl-CoA epoxidase subunit PaaE
MSIHFHPLVIKEVRRETTDCVSVEFEIPDQIRSEFRFFQGQSLTMRAMIDGEEVRRTYSICSSPLDNEWRVAIKKVEGGLFSTFANEKLRRGDKLDVMPPVGKFYTELNPANKKNYLAFAAGSGITPVISLIKTTLRTEPGSSFTLIYGNKRRSSIIFFEELEGLKNQFIERFTLIHLLSREKTDAPVNSGRITPEKLNELGKLVDYNGFDEYFICGPEQLIFCVKDFLEAKNIEKKKIHFELFTTPGEKKFKIPNPKSKIDEGPRSRISIKLDGRVMEFEHPFQSDQTILDAALQQGADLPFACKGGVCTTCKARLTEGEVQMDVHWGLEDEEVSAGYILTCQSHPKTESVKIDFDVR